MGRSGKICLSQAAKNGCAAGLIPTHDNAPPCSTRRSKSCAAGVFETAANKLLVAVCDEPRAKLGKGRRGKSARQGGQNDYSHSIVPGGLLVMSKTQRFTPFTSLMMRLESFSSRSYGSLTQSAVMPSCDSTARIARV